MPRVKAYKYKNSSNIIIPVDEARVSTAYRCPWSNELFGTKKQYVKHLRILREERMHKNARVARWTRVRDELSNQPTFSKVIQWIENHPEFFFDTAMRYSFVGSRHHEATSNPIVRDTFSIKLTRLKLQWSDDVSNTHNCPRGGKTNFLGTDDAPRGYPGWRGYIEVELTAWSPGRKHTFAPFSASDMFNNTGICTGSGGARGNGMHNEMKKFGYEVIFFDSDWPQIAERREKEAMLAALDPSRKTGSSYSYDGRDKITIAG